MWDRATEISYNNIVVSLNYILKTDYAQKPLRTAGQNLINLFPQRNNKQHVAKQRKTCGKFLLELEALTEPSCKGKVCFASTNKRDI